jgi:pimeloyl-ACP methyl ester carboxylesterase
MWDGYVSVNGVSLHCVATGPEAGSDADAAMVLFLHGFPEFWYEWRHQLEEFGKDHFVVAPDLRGYNLSEKPAELQAYRVPVLIEDIRGLADHFRKGKKFILVAHDWGGALAWGFAMAFPDYLEELIVLNAPHPGIFRKLLESDAGQQAASQYMLMFRSPQAEAMLAADNFALLVQIVLEPLLASGAMTEADKVEYLKAWSQPGALTGGLNYYRANRTGPPVPQEMEAAIGASGTLLPQWTEAQMIVRVPTLVIWGEQDQALTVKNLDGLERYVPELKVKRIADASHWVVHEKREEVNAHIREFIR